VTVTMSTVKGDGETLQKVVGTELWMSDEEEEEERPESAPISSTMRGEDGEPLSKKKRKSGGSGGVRSPSPPLPFSVFDSSSNSNGIDSFSVAQVIKLLLISPFPL